MSELDNFFRMKFVLAKKIARQEEILYDLDNEMKELNRSIDLQQESDNERFILQIRTHKTIKTKKQ